MVLALVEPLVPKNLGAVAVYGAGAGRLAVDLHQSCSPTRTFALDVNPLPFLIADHLVAGEAVDLTEFPIDPGTDAEVVIPRHVTCPFPVRDGFDLVFADALRPPFAPGSLDAVVTPWFIDIVRSDLRQTAAAINRVLPPGGLWVSLGPLRFHQELSRCYTIEEVSEIVADSGFELGAPARADVPYFDSPVSGSRRNETVFSFAAKKTAEAKPVETPDLYPPWVTNPRVPIPITPALVALGRTSMFTTTVLGAIDGTRAVADIAAGLGASWGIDPAQLQDQLRAFLAKLPAG